MNLGDGLKLETQILNGKTKLILAPYDVQEKASKQVGNRSRARVTALKVKRQPQVLHTVQNNHDRAEQLVLKSRSGKVSAGRPPTNVLKELENKKLAPLSQQNAQQTKADAGTAKPVPTKFTNVPKQRPQQKPAITAEDLRESLVCLTQEQFRQILLTINHGSKPNAQEQPADQGEAVHFDHSQAPSCNADVIPEASWNAANSIMKPSVTALISPRRDTAVQTDDLDTGIKSKSVSNGLSWRQEQSSSPDIPVEFTYQQSKADQPGKKVRSQRDRSESTKENTIDDIYDQYARTEKQAREPGRKPDWNRNRPPKKYVPASERYPKGLQKQREESKGRRQMELLHLVEKNSSSNLNARKGYSPERSPVREEAKISHPPEEIKPTLEAQKEEKFHKVDPYYKRSESPPVPAVKNRLHQAQRKSNKTPVPIVYSGNPISAQINLSQEPDKQEAHRPPSSQFVPYVRTKEIYYLDPDAPMSRPSTHDPQYKHTAADQESRQIFSSDHIRDPLLNPNVVRNKDRQQAILRGLSELRKGLLQKQRELETCLMPDV
ncbi:coiled-coil domain-containing protein 66 [Mantella aurantiaca]